MTGALSSRISTILPLIDEARARRARVLERSVRLEKSRSLPGVGLGLSLVQAIAEVRGADLVLDDGPGVAFGGHGPGLRIALCFAKAK